MAFIITSVKKSGPANENSFNTFSKYNRNIKIMNKKWKIRKLHLQNYICTYDTEFNCFKVNAYFYEQSEQKVNHWTMMT